MSTPTFGHLNSPRGAVQSQNWVWSAGLLDWVPEAQAAGGGGAATIADGADVALGATTDLAVVTDTTGTVSGKLRGLVKWAFERMPASLGQKAMAASFPVTVASDQSALNVKLQDGSGNALVSSTTPPVITERGLAVREIPILNSTTGTLDALDEVVELAMLGAGNAVFTLDPTSLDGAITLQASFDGGGSYVNVDGFALRAGGFRQVGTETITGATARIYLIGPPSYGMTHARVKCTTYNSGSATITARVTDIPYDAMFAAVGGNDLGNWTGGVVVVGGKNPSSRAQAMDMIASGSPSPFNWGPVVHVGSMHQTAQRVRNAADSAFIDPLTDTQLRATPVPVSDGGASITVDGTVAVSGTVTTKETRASTPTQSSVNDSATSVTILAANANRLGATIANDSTAALFIKLGATASLTSYTCRLVQHAYYEVPFGYTGVIDGIWATDPNDGAARVTELTA